MLNINTWLDVIRGIPAPIEGIIIILSAMLFTVGMVVLEDVLDGKWRRK